MFASLLRARRRGLVPVCMLALAAAAPEARAQGAATCAPGFGAQAALTELGQAPSVVGFAHDPATGHHYLAVGNTLFHRPNAATWNTAWTAPAGDVLAAVARSDTQSSILVATLLGGIVKQIDTASGAMVTIQGVPNVFDLAPAPNGTVLASANPTWPAPGANSGVWVLGTGSAPRLLLQLQGPSGPLCLDASGNLLVAEIGTAVPPLPGSVRILRFPAATWQAAAASGTTVTPAQADAVSTGWNGAYDLAVDDSGRIHVTDPNSNVVSRTLPGSTVRDPVPLCTLGRPGLQVQFAPGAALPFAPWLHEEHAGALFVASSDFSSEYRVERIHPQRPRLDALPGTTLGAGTGTLRIGAAPPGAPAFLAFSLAPPRSEQLVAVVDGLPFWLGLDPAAPVVARALTADASGVAQLAFSHPGGFALQLTVQGALLLPAAGITSSSLVSLQLLP
ncbi:MAG: hypothetical protein RL148_1982 [Planctomycetota bacterium]